MRTILFVDDEPKVLQALQRMLHQLRNEWEMEFVGSGAEALELLSKRPFEVIVSDMRMPGMNGAQLMTEVMRRHPQIVRIILSGYSDQEMILKSVGPAHQFLSKPCEAQALKETVTRVYALRDLLADKTLQRLVSQMQSLPSLPSLYAELVRELQSPDASVRKVGEIISKDVGMTAKILQLVNSAFFCMRRHISSPSEAVSLLGLDTVMTLTLTINVFSQFERIHLSGFSLSALWSHSLRVGAIAKRITQEMSQDTDTVKDAFTAGLLHDVGQLVLAANLPQEYAQMSALKSTDRIPYDEAERRVFGSTHAEVGAYLLGLWGLPNTIVEAVAFNYHPDRCIARGFGPLTAVHMGNALEHEAHDGSPVCCDATINMDHLTSLGLANQLPAWREIGKQVAENEIGDQ